MLITFSTTVHPDVVMFGDIATLFLRVMGEKEQAPGILRGDNIKLARDRLQAWLSEVPPEPNNDENDEADDADNGEQQGRRSSSIGLKKRALPLLELMDLAYRKQADVIWR